MGAAYHRGSSETSVGTPRVFLDAVERRWGAMAVDLAGDATNAKAPLVITKEQDSLSRDWGQLVGNLWLNPPYDDIRPWAEKCAKTPVEAPRRRIFLLVPASVGSKWFADFVHGRAMVYALTGRLTFEGHTQPYPKDLILAVYDHLASGFETWDWRKP